MSILGRASVLLLALSALVLCDSTPFTLIASSSNTTLDGMHAYISDPTNTYDAVLLFTDDPLIAPTNFTLDDSGGHFLAHTSYATEPLLEANTDNGGYDETVFFSSLEVVADGENPPLCHEFSNYISCSVTSEGGTKLKKLYVCPPGVGFITTGNSLKIGNVVPTGCSDVQLNFTSCVGSC